ncbi:hypothetical protein [Halopelagius longus]|uniref:Uncharacterized protein n=1 Tax=Halopelagius longus TaxID=1236180 RepID=A0A1H1G9D8_9EURY|nr:hypothetical protein [Halopelagius longus]RDI69761.1 hypothetical protein DWB78_16545 [Halopelagius longus]SDR09854.1 hypothetical protein SAMN05216278_3610 [Halopelagius longus]
MNWSREEFWERMEGFRVLWFCLAVADVLFGLVAVATLVVMPFDTSEPSVVIAVLDIAIVVVTLVPLTYVLYRLRQRQREKEARRATAE